MDKCCAVVSTAGGVMSGCRQTKPRVELGGIAGAGPSE